MDRISDLINDLKKNEDLYYSFIKETINKILELRCFSCDYFDDTKKEKLVYGDITGDAVGGPYYGWYKEYSKYNCKKKVIERSDLRNIIDYSHRTYLDYIITCKEYKKSKSRR